MEKSAEVALKRKLRRRNQRWLSVQLQIAHDENLPLSFFINFPAQGAAACNGMRLERRARLKPDWQQALFHKGWGGSTDGGARRWHLLVNKL